MQKHYNFLNHFLGIARAAAAAAAAERPEFYGTAERLGGD